MASASAEARRAALSPKPKGRENAKDTLCRNVTIYGHCRYEDKGCAFNHDPSKKRNNTMGGSGKRLNVDSPTFTPNTQHATLAIADPNRGSGLSPKAASAAPFKPKGLSSGIEFNPGGTMRKTYNPNAPDWTLGVNGSDSSEFLPGSHNLQAAMGVTNDMQGILNGYANSPNLLAQSPGQAHLANYQYAQELASNSSIFNGVSGFVPPMQLHLNKSGTSAPKHIGPNQRTATHFFMDENLRDELHRKQEATQQRLENSGLPYKVDWFHSLVPLDKANQRNDRVFDYPSWVYKVFSEQDGNVYTLRRIEGFNRSADQFVVAYEPWKRISSPYIVTCHAAFTSRDFGDLSLMFQTAFHANAKTLAETHQLGTRMQSRTPVQYVPEAKLWQYMVQIANALLTIHTAGLAARVIDPSKILVTGPDQIRLNACGIKDVLGFEVQKPLAELQREDFKQFGRLIVALGAGKASTQTTLSNALDHFNRVYSQPLKERVQWLMNQPPDKAEGITQFLTGLTIEMAKALCKTQERENTMEQQLQLCINNDFMFRTLLKLNTVIDHPARSVVWNNSGSRDPLRLLRDYMFHPVDVQGKPIFDLARVVDCLQQLDVGTDTKVQLVSRDNQIIIVVSWKELKNILRSQYEEIAKQRNTRVT